MLCTNEIELFFLGLNIPSIKIITDYFHGLSLIVDDL